jgi:hypothetical protein|tara:strand:- start:80 stop:259 length:180 start_codon:yes stop_codon:yes gene_type:complete
MEEIENKIGTLIDEIEGDEKMPQTDILLALYALKSEVEDMILQQEEGRSFEWEDLDGPN